VLRFLAGGVGLFLLTLGIGFLTLPEVFATGFFVEPARAVGINAIRGDFGALFLGMGIFGLLGAATAHRRLLAVPIVFLALVVAGRLTSLVVDDVPNVVAGSIAAELSFLAVLVLCLLAAPAGRKPAEDGSAFRQFLNSRVLATAAVVILVVLGIFIFQKRIGMALTEVLARRFAAVDVLEGLPDGLHVGLCGAGSPLADSKRSGPCTFVIAGKSLYVVDSGPGSTRKFELLRLQTGQIKAVLLTHFHSDHIGDLGELMLKRWAGGARQAPLEVIGPPGVQTVVAGFNRAYSLDAGHRVAHHGEGTVPPSGAGGVAKPFDFPQGKEALVVIDEDGLKVTAFAVDHRPVAPAVGYRFDYKGRSLVISGDTLPCDSLRRQSVGVDLLMHEALQPAMVRALGRAYLESGRANVAAIASDILNYHTSPEEAARIARDAGVRHLILYHVIPPLPVSILNPAFLGDAGKFFSGPITIGVDGLFFSLPAGSREIIKKWLWS
jgi:ribonuclease Z